MISTRTIKKLLWNPKFRNKFPSLQKPIKRFLRNPGCGCNRPLLVQIQKMETLIREFYAEEGINIEDADMEDDKKNRETKNNFTVINCHKDELQPLLKKLPNGPKQIAVARWEDQVTVIVNEVTFSV